MSQLRNSKKKSILVLTLINICIITLQHVTKYLQYCTVSVVLCRYDIKLQIL